MERISFTASLITQGKHKFYSLAIPSSILAKTCFVTIRNEDPIEGFQRMLDKEKAQSIADYIDNGLGTIPTAIILSAQEDSEFTYNSKNKSLEFNVIPRAFLIIDGQHRVYGFTKAKNEVRVPVILYSDLTRKEETRLFIDINTKQKPVPQELLLDIKSLAEVENNSESFLRNIFDTFKDTPGSALHGKLSSDAKKKDKISRVTFNAAMKPVSQIFGSRTALEVYEILNAYLKAIELGFKRKGIESKITNPYVFRAILGIFQEVAQKLKVQQNEYTVEGFTNSLSTFFDVISTTKINKATSGYLDLQNHFSQSLKQDFTL